jgi:hypothetical protein
MDDADLAGRFDDILRQSNLYQSRKNTPTIAAIGECLWCGAPVEAGRRWCNAECRDDWESENAT